MNLRFGQGGTSEKVFEIMATKQSRVVSTKPADVNWDPRSPVPGSCIILNFQICIHFPTFLSELPCISWGSGAHTTEVVTFLLQNIWSVIFLSTFFKILKHNLY